MSRLWTDPPLKPDGTLDYRQLILAEICEDLTESLMDRVINGGDQDLSGYLDDLPDVDAFSAGASASEVLIESMEELLRLEGEDSNFRNPQAREALSRAVRELRDAASK